MINKECFLTDKGKLYVVLHSECKYIHLSNSSICNGCEYYTHKERTLKASASQELINDLSLYSGVDVEKEFQLILDMEIKIGQEKGYIK